MTDKYRVHEIVRFNYSDIGEYIDENHTDRPLRNDILVELLNELYEENKELKERNNRQCQQLDKLYKLIEKQDWNSLTGIVQELKEADERLQEEWGAYGDLE